MSSGRTERLPYAAAIVLAAGLGSRLQAGRKGLVELGGLPLYAWSVKAMLASPFIGQVVLVVHSQDVSGVTRAVSRRFKDRRLKIQAGGVERQDSVRLGLQATDAHFEVVLVHDAARPFLRQSLIRECAQIARLKGGAVACVPVKDSVHVLRNGRLVGLDRATLRAAQTPQAYQAQLLRRAHQAAAKKKAYYTDEAGLAEASGIPSVPVMSYEENFKITTPRDLSAARGQIKGFDFK